MRTITLLGVVALASGCAALDSDLQYRGTLDNTVTNGVVLFEDGSGGHAAMSGTTCEIETNGGIQNDVEIIEGQDEEILDGSKDGDGSVVLARTRGQLHIMTQGSIVEDLNFNFAQPDFLHVDVPNITDAALIDDGIATLAGCEVQWLDAKGELVDANLIDLADCTGMDGTFDVDRLTGTAYVGNGDSLFAVSPDAVTELASAGDIFVVSQQLQGLALADAGSNMVRFSDLNGVEQWSAQLDGSVTDVADFGARGWIAAMVQHDAGATLQVLDAATGARVKSFTLPAAAEIVPAANGETLALVLPEAVHYYNLR